MKISNKWVFKALVIALSLISNAIWATPTDFGACVKKNKQFAGATGACAEDICNWEVCKDQVIYATGSTGVTTEAPLSYNRDPGAWGAALAACKPKEQIMNQCLKR